MVMAPADAMITSSAPTRVGGDCASEEIPDECVPETGNGSGAARFSEKVDVGSSGAMGLKLDVISRRRLDPDRLRPLSTGVHISLPERMLGSSATFTDESLSKSMMSQLRVRLRGRQKSGSSAF